MLLLAVILGSAVFVMAWIVSARLFALAGRTGGKPERTTAIALSALFCCGYPLAAASRAPGLDGTYEGSLFFTISMIAITIGIGALYRLPQMIFRPRRPWAILLRNLAATAGAIAGAGSAFAVTVTPRPEEMIQATRPWAIALMTTILLPFLWHGIEATLHYRRMQRRLKLGLADPVTTHRFLLWAVCSWLAVATHGTVIVLRAADIPIRSPFPFTLIALDALLCIACVELIFQMPRAYRIHVIGAPDPAGQMASSNSS